jgi:hypothetical protein
MQQQGGPWKGWLVLVVLWWPASAAAAGPVRAQGGVEPRTALRLVYTTTGSLPGREKARDLKQEDHATEAPATSTQQITVDASGLRLLWEEMGTDGKPTRRVILRADRTVPVIQELLDDGKSYRELSGDLNKHQQERTVQELAVLPLILGGSKAEREEFFRENPHLRPDGKREVKVIREAREPFLGKVCERILLTENGRPIIDGLITREVPGARSYYELFRRLGAFSDEVLRELAKVDGLLLRGKITVVTALRVDAFEVEARSVEPVELRPDFFEVDQLRRVEEVPREQQCLSCGKSFESKSGTRFVLDGKLVPICSEACAAQMRRKILDRK